MLCRFFNLLPLKVTCPYALAPSSPPIYVPPPVFFYKTACINLNASFALESMNYQGLMPQGCLAGISGIYDGRDEHISHQTGAGGAYQTAAVPGTGAQHNLAGGAYKTAAIPQTGGQHSLPGGASETGPSEPESSKSGLHALVS